jgi:nucleotide-binding universal stress UspA family protein
MTQPLPEPATAPPVSGQEVADSSVGELFGHVAQDLSVLLRQELDLAKAEVKQEVSTAGTRGNPLAAGLIAFGAGWLVSSLLPASEREQQAAAQLKDLAAEKGAPAVQQLGQAGQEAAQELRESAQQRVQSVKETAADAASTVAGEAQSQAADVTSHAQDAKGKVTEQVSPGE